MFRKTKRFIVRHRSDILQMAVMAAVLVVPHATGWASEVGGTVVTGMPWDTGINTMQNAMTGPLPKAGAAISVASAGAMWMFGDSQITKVAMRCCLGSGIALSAPTAVKALAGADTVSGCLF